jgi:hypothetical protein
MPFNLIGGTIPPLLRQSSFQGVYDWLVLDLVLIVVPPYLEKAKGTLLPSDIHALITMIVQTLRQKDGSISIIHQH